jgi:hypothetical protein
MGAEGFGKETLMTRLATTSTESQIEFRRPPHVSGSPSRSLRKKPSPKLQVTVEADGLERREHRRHDLERQEINVDRWDGKRNGGETLGKIVDISAGGVRIRTRSTNIKADHQIRVRLELPDFAGICPFIEPSESGLKPKREWVGWVAVSRVVACEDDTHIDIAGRLVDMDEMDRGMLGLYLSTQPLAA